MEYYVLHVQTGKEQDFVNFAQNPRNGAPGGKLYLPVRELEIMRAGKKTRDRKPLYPGYVFWGTMGIEPSDTWLWRKVPFFFRILGVNGLPKPLGAEDLMLLHHFMSHGEVLGLSQVEFDSDDRIVIRSGPMKGLEGRIVKVDKRKRRARVRLDMYETASEIDFGFEILEPREKEGDT